jgi:alkaline phosphatase D
MHSSSRRQFIQHTALTGAAIAGLGEISEAFAKPAPGPLPSSRPNASWGLQIGDVGGDSAIVWSRADRSSRLIVEWSHDQRFRRPCRVEGTLAVEASDYTARVDLSGLPADADVFLRAYFENGRLHGKSAPIYGRFRTPPRRARKARFVWGGDTAGQGWGIDLEYGGMKLYETMRLRNPDFFLHSGDNIYADGPMVPEVVDATGQVIWKNAYLDVIPEKLKVAETLHEFRRNYLYNRMDEHVRDFSAEVPQIWQWDDHEITNNWSPSKVLDSRYTQVTDIATLVANGTRAFLEHSPNRWGRGDDLGRIYRQISYGPDLDVFVLDMRTYRAGNGCNVELEPGPTTVMLGQEQIAWLERKLKSSRATWKIIAADMPLGLVVGDGRDPSGCPRFENSSNGNGPVLGREFEIAEILRFIKRQRIQNTVWLTADVHYCAAHYYDPSVARFQDFEPFWEFVSGPLHAGSFGPNALDDTFGPTVIFQKAPPAGQSNLPPSAGLQFFGEAEIDARTKTLKVGFRDTNGTEIFSQELEPTGRR